MIAAARQLTGADVVVLVCIVALLAAGVVLLVGRDWPLFAAAATFLVLSALTVAALEQKDRP